MVAKVDRECHAPRPNGAAASRATAGKSRAAVTAPPESAHAPPIEYHDRPRAAALLALQRSAGNRAVGAWVASRAPEASAPSPGRAPVVQRDPGGEPASGNATLETVGDVSVYAGTTMTAEDALREIYKKSARQISERARALVAEGQSVEDAARWAHEARNTLKTTIRARGSPIVKGLAEARNIKKYGDKVGPTFDELIREGKTPEDIIGSTGRANLKVNKIATRIRFAGRLLILLDVAIVTWEVVEAEENKRLRTAVGGAAGVAGAVAGGWAGAKGGAAVGGVIGSFFAPGPGTAIGGAIGGFIGGVGGAIAGGYYARKGAEAAYDYLEELFTPTLDADLSDIDAAEDRYIRQLEPVG